MSNIISRGADWDFDLLEQYDTAIAGVAAGFGLDTYPNQIEIITSEQMLDAYATSGLPVGYPHWSMARSSFATSRRIAAASRVSPTRSSSTRIPASRT
jgi:spore cortex formation protein SpoVR/YcgB (stage V sporulation)